jgi:hypothetical protein
MGSRALIKNRILTYRMDQSERAPELLIINHAEFTDENEI